jgi:hypothetical protein
MTMRSAVASFQQAVLRRRVAARFAMEHSSPEERKNYLQEHPNADPADHTIKKGKPKGKPEIDTSDAESAASASKSRFDSNKSAFQSIKKLSPKDKKYQQGYKKLEKSGDDAAAAGEKMLKKYENMADGYKGTAKREREAMVEMLSRHVDGWERAKNDFHPMSSSDRLANLYAAAQQIETYLQALPKSLKGDQNVAIDDSWREH